MSKDVILSFASKGREDYRAMLLRLIDSCIDHWKGDVLVYSPDHHLQEYRGVTIHKGYPKPRGVNSYTHQEMPYQFKTAMIQLAREQGYERIVWLDSSMQLTRDITPLFEKSRTGIITFHNLGHDTWRYLSDRAQEMLEVSDEELKTIPQIWGGAFMLDFTKPDVDDFFELLKFYSVNGSFGNSTSKRPGFIAHRHDQSVMSVLVHGICDMMPYGTIVCPPHHITKEYGEDYYLLCKGL
jgi:hypothetical protein